MEDHNFVVEPLEVVTLSVEEYEFFIMQYWPLNVFREKYRPIFKLIVPDVFIDEATTFLRHNYDNIGSAVLEDKTNQNSSRDGPGIERSTRNGKIFQQQSHLDSPLNFALEKGAVTGMHHPLLYVGPPHAATCFHRDDFYQS
ncbi:unnamed protein product [Allacma fusca]|uniref:JmjC domain-containing protein n=1 Tax=Allacma fusca TaxID=39272 RepID=A0A8J2JM08_9HEXA|nr:unnamed protein product [Allacma fusca]